MVTIVKPFSGDGRIVYEVTPVKPSFVDIIPPIKHSYKKPYETGNRDFFLNYRKHVISKYTVSVKSRMVFQTVELILTVVVAAMHV